MAFDPTLITAIVAGIAAVVGSGITVFTARIASGPSGEQALTDRFTALIDRQEKEREHLVADYERREAKLERVAGDLEVMVVKMLAWADEVTVVALRRGVDLPARPKFERLN